MLLIRWEGNRLYVWVVNDDFYSIYYKLFHTIIDISPLSADRNTIFYKVLYKQFQTLEEKWKKKKEKCLIEAWRERALWAGKKLTPEPHNIKAINQIFINLLDSVTIKTVQWFSRLAIVKLFPPLHQHSDLWFRKKRAERKGQEWWMLYNKLCFPLLINLFGIFRTKWFASDVSVSCRLFANKVIGFSASQTGRGKLWEVKSLPGEEDCRLRNALQGLGNFNNFWLVCLPTLLSLHVPQAWTIPRKSTQLPHNW